MSILTLVIRKKSDDVAVLSLGIGFRIFFYGLALYLGGVLIMDTDPTGSNIGPIIFIVLSLICGSYYEAVYLDRKERMVIRHYGLLFLNKRRCIPFDDIESIRVDRFLRGKLQEGVPDPKPISKNPLSTKATCKLYFILKNGDFTDIEMLTERHYDKLKEKAKFISEFCDIPITGSASV